MNPDSPPAAKNNPAPDLAGHKALPSANQLALLLRLERSAFAAQNASELGFVIVNETNSLSEYRQSMILKRNISGQFTLFQASGLANIVEDSPFSIWLQSLIVSLEIDRKRTQPLVIHCDSIRDDLKRAG